MMTRRRPRRAPRRGALPVLEHRGHARGPARSGA